MGFWRGLLKCLFSPFLLMYYSLALYCLPCTRVYLGRFTSWVLCCACWVTSCACCRFTDKSFPTTPSSLGSDYTGNLQDVEWRRAYTFMQGKPKLVSGKIEPSDVQQGGLGNCWLMSAFACLAEYPGVIRGLFNTKEYSVRGKYRVRIYDQPSKKWQTITVDDHFPCSKRTGGPIFAKPNDQELWVMVYEKAFAKYCGSYQGLSGGNSVWALQAMTGDPVFKLMCESGDGSWRRYDLTYHCSDASPTRKKRTIGLQNTSEAYTAERMFNILQEYNEKGACLGASSQAGSDSASEAVNGIVQGHAYSILKVKKVNNFLMLQLRNPWGSFEWKGPWCDGSGLWEAYPNVRKECNYSPSEDGTFWMCLEDFIKHFRCVDVLDRSTGMKDLALDLYEDKGCCGPLLGCCVGCCKFWCCCHGCYRLLCSYTATGATRHGRKCCCCWC